MENNLNYNFQLFIQELWQIIAGIGPQPGYQPKSMPQPQPGCTKNAWFGLEKQSS